MMLGTWKDRRGRLWRVAAAVLLAMIVGGLVFSRLRPGAANRYENAVFEPRAVTLAPGVHLLGALSPGAAYLVETSAGHVLIDSGLESDAGLVASQIYELGLDLRQLKAILLTHVHGDHSLGARRLRALTGAAIYAGAGDREVLESGGPREGFFSTFSMPGVPVHATRADSLLQGGERIEVGDTVFHCLATPGHTPGSCCFRMERGGESILFTGDTITSLTSGLGTYAAHLSPRYRGDAEAYLASLEKLRRLPAPDLVLPGHPRMDRVGQSPRLSEEAWNRLLEGGIDELRQLVARLGSDGRDFLDGEPRRILPGLWYLGEFHQWAVYVAQQDGRRFVFDAPGGAGLTRFIEQRLEQLQVEPAPLTAVLLTATDTAATAGLPELVKETGCQVVAAGSLARLRRICPPETRFLRAEQLEDEEWLAVRVLRLAGRGTSPVAYRLDWQGRRVLVSGRIPVRTSALSLEQMRRDLTGPVGDPMGYFQSLMLLGELDPEIWLPAYPVHGQNANLYGDQWRATVLDNQTIVERFTSPQAPGRMLEQ